jgi:hypothetical protein
LCHLPPTGLDQKAYLLARGSSGGSKVRTAGFQWLHLDFDHADALQGHFVASAVAIRSELKQALFMAGHGM